jgi:uncharacterized protein
MYRHFGLVLMVNHGCNLACTYCYTGSKFHRPMPADIGRRSIDRAIASLEPGGVLELSFFGGEPLVEAALISNFLGYAAERVAEKGIEPRPGMTTNGTVTTPAAWGVMLRPDLDLTLSHDGLPEVHDRHRRTPAGHATAHHVEATMLRLHAEGKAFRVNMVVRPDTLPHVVAGIQHLQDLGVTRIDLSLDLWRRWTNGDTQMLSEVVGRCATLWREALPRLSLNWFDEKAAMLARVPVEESARCGFGKGEIAVAPSGNLYPCERLIGEDAGDNPIRLPGNALDGVDFLHFADTPGRSHAACNSCDMNYACTTTCRCSNFVRTGDPSRPDRLLCILNEASLRETDRVLGPIVPLRVLRESEVPA